MIEAKVTPAKQWNAFLVTFSPEIVKLVKASVANVRKPVPGAVVMRHIRSSDQKLIHSPGVFELMTRALAAAPKPIAPKAKRRPVIRPTAPKQRPRCP